MAPFLLEMVFYFRNLCTYPDSIDDSRTYLLSQSFRKLHTETTCDYENLSPPDSGSLFVPQQVFDPLLLSQPLLMRCFQSLFPQLPADHSPASCAFLPAEYGSAQAPFVGLKSFCSFSIDLFKRRLHQRTAEPPRVFIRIKRCRIPRIIIVYQHPAPQQIPQ